MADANGLNPQHNLLRSQLGNLLRQYGLRIVLDELATVLQCAAMDEKPVYYDKLHENQIDHSDVEMIAHNLRSPMY